MDLLAQRRKLERDRQTRLRSIGVSDGAVRVSELAAIDARREEDCIRVMQWNLLADGLSGDGFLVRDVLQDWPAGEGNVPTTDKQHVNFDSLLDQIVAARGDEKALKAIKDRFCVPAAEENARAIVDWPGRELQIQLQVIAAGRPDMLVFQECDHYGPLSEGLAKLGYCSSLPSSCPAKSYEPAHLRGYDPVKRPEEFQRAIQEQGFAFLPSVGSTAMHQTLSKDGYREKVHMAARELSLEDQLFEGDSLKRKSFMGLKTGSLLDKAGIPQGSIDDDGVAIFWRSDRFTAVSLHVHLFPGGNGGALKVKLKERFCSSRDLVLIGVHLGSGDDLKSEERRLTEQVNVQGGLREMTQDAIELGEPVVLAMDANSHPPIGVDTNGPGMDSPSVWCSLHGAPDKPLFASVWDDHFDATGRMSSSSSSQGAPVTSNKIRGPLSGQAKKIGLHSLYCIDHIFFSPAELSLRGHVLPPKQFPSEMEARQMLNPSLSCPSDHYPVIVDLSWPLKGPEAQLRVSAGKPASMYSSKAAELLKGTEDREPVLKLYISGLGSAIRVAVEVAQSLEHDGLGRIARIQTDYQDLREAKPRRGRTWSPQLIIAVEKVT